jgi:hypothetical protein
VLVKVLRDGFESRTLQLSEGETTAGPDAAVVLDGRASHNGAEEVDGAGGNLRGLGNTGVASGLLLARLSSVNIRDTGATALSGVRGELPGRSARGRSVAWGGQRNSQRQMGARRGCSQSRNRSASGRATYQSLWKWFFWICWLCLMAIFADCRGPVLVRADAGKFEVAARENGSSVGGAGGTISRRSVVRWVLVGLARQTQHRRHGFLRARYGCMSTVI